MKPSPLRAPQSTGRANFVSISREKRGGYLCWLAAILLIFILCSNALGQTLEREVEQMLRITPAEEVPDVLSRSGSDVEMVLRQKFLRAEPFSWKYVWALGELKLKAAVPFLLEYLDIGKLNERPPSDIRYAMEALGKIGDARAEAPLLGILHSGDSTDIAIRLAAAEALARFASHEGRSAALSAVIDYLRSLGKPPQGSPEAEKASAALAALRNMGDSRAEPALLEFMQGGVGVQIQARLEAAEALGRLASKDGRRKAAEFVLATLDDKTYNDGIPYEGGMPCEIYEAMCSNSADDRVLLEVCELLRSADGPAGVLGDMASRLTEMVKQGCFSPEQRKRLFEAIAEGLGVGARNDSCISTDSLVAIARMMSEYPDDLSRGAESLVGEALAAHHKKLEDLSAKGGGDHVQEGVARIEALLPLYTRGPSE